MKLSHLHESDEEYRRLTRHPEEMTTRDHIRASRENLGRFDKEKDWIEDQIQAWHNRHVNHAPAAELEAILDNILQHFENYDFTNAPNDLIRHVQWAQREKVDLQQQKDRQIMGTDEHRWATEPTDEYRAATERNQEAIRADARLHGPITPLTSTQRWKQESDTRDDWVSEPVPAQYDFCIDCKRSKDPRSPNHCKCKKRHDEDQHQPNAGLDELLNQVLDNNDIDDQELHF